MVSLRWCCRTKDGTKLIEPNDNLALSYIKMAENAIGTMNRERFNPKGIYIAKTSIKYGNIAMAFHLLGWDKIGYGL